MCCFYYLVLLVHGAFIPTTLLAHSALSDCSSRLHAERWQVAVCSVLSNGLAAQSTSTPHLVYTLWGDRPAGTRARKPWARGDVFLTFLHLGIWTETHTSLKREKCALGLCQAYGEHFVVNFNVEQASFRVMCSGGVRAFLE